ncbi:unnamed protein product [Lathyrus sativus]|nr:unnamed protein product [Lathyrus sativus]
MKPHLHVSGENSPTNEFRKPVGEKLKRIEDASRKGGVQMCDKIERRRWSHRDEDPIRTLMFLGSWSHT